MAKKAVLLVTVASHLVIGSGCGGDTPFYAINKLLCNIVYWLTPAGNGWCGQ